jgi:hypothetical protein
VIPIATRQLLRVAPGVNTTWCARDLCHVTQPRVEINISCSHAGHKEVAGGLVDYLRSWFPCQQRVGTGPGTGQGGTGTSEIADEIAPEIAPRSILTTWLPVPLLLDEGKEYI